MPTEVIYLYAEHHTLAGKRCWKDADDRDDVTQHDVTVAEYRRLRRMSRTAGAGRDLFLRRCAREVMAALR
jgi:hypothetical protein